LGCSPEFLAHLEDALAPLGEIKARRMFGGAGIFRARLMFALVADDVVYFKAGPRNRVAFAAAGSVPFAYDTKLGRNVIASYWRVPEAVLDDEAELLAWGREALAAARDAADAKPRRKG